jgi:adenosine deaminase
MIDPRDEKSSAWPREGGRRLYELHLHLEGALTAARSHALAASLDGAPPAPDGVWQGSGASRSWSFGNFQGFLEAFGWASRLLRTPRAYLAVLDDLIDALDRDGVEGAEVFVAIGQMHRGGTDPAAILPALARRAEERAAAGSADLWFIADATRNWGRDAVERVLDAALDLQEHRIVGFGVGGDETSLPVRELRAVYRRASQNGLGLSCHAGEGTHADAVRATVDELGVRRIGHGIAAATDERLLRELRDDGVVLEVCPTSNERTGVWDPGTPHPVLRLLERGVAVVLGSDDPAFFRSSLPGEFERLRGWGVDEASLDRIAACAFASRFPRSA